MPRAAVMPSESGFRHAVPKGESDRPLFIDDDDRVRYLELLKRAQEEYDFIVIAYCLMGNHVHLLVEGEDFSAAMKFIDERYGTYFKKKAGLSGRTFRRPLWSEPVETEERLLCTVRYIHANPEVAGIAHALAYRWSSAQEYLGRPGIAHTALVLDMIGGPDRFVEFSAEYVSAQPFPGSKLRAHISEDEILRVARNAIGEEELRTIRGQSTSRQRALLCRLGEVGLTRSQCARVTGLSEGRVRYLLKGWSR